MSKQILRETLSVRRSIDVNVNNLKDQVVAIQRVTKVGNSIPQELEFPIPIRVVEHGAKVTPDGRYREDVPLAVKIVIILLLPIIFPFALPDC